MRFIPFANIIILILILTTGSCNLFLSLGNQGEELIITPPTAEIVPAAQIQLVAFKKSADGTLTDVTRSAIRTSNTLGVADIAGPGLVAGQSPGSTLVIATCSGQKKTAVIDVVIPAPTPDPTGAPVIELSDGTNTYSSGAHFNFGQVTVGDSKTIVFTIKNTGSRVLVLSGSSPLTLSGTNSADFTVTQPLVVSIDPDTSSAFTLGFTPVGAGSRTGVLSIASNDPLVPGFTVNLTGTAFVPILVVHGNGTNTSSLFDPVTGSFKPGPPLPAGIGVGSFSFDVQVGPDRAGFWYPRAQAPPRRFSTIDPRPDSCRAPTFRRLSGMKVHGSI